MGLSQSSLPQDWKQTAEYNWINQKLNEDKVVLFSKTTCPFCVSAKRIFEAENAAYRSYELNQMQNGSQIQDILAAMTGARTVPRIFINGQTVGGCDDLKRLKATGKLAQMLNEPQKTLTVSEGGDQ